MMGIISKVGSVLFHIVGGLVGRHAVGTILSGTPVAPVAAAWELLGWRFFLGFGAALAIFHPEFRHALFDLFGSIV